MKKLILLFLICFTASLSIKAQIKTCDCKTDLDFIVEKLKKTPSYKNQIKGDALEDFNKTYQSISVNMDSSISIVDCYKKIQQLITSVNDFHFNLYFNYNDDKSYLGHYTEEEVALLNESLKKADSHPIEGIYNFGKIGMTIGITLKNENNIEGVVLSSKDSIWQKGDVFLVGTKNKFDKYNLIYYKPDVKQLQMLNNITSDNGRLLSLKKINNSFNKEFKKDKTSNWEFKQISKDVQYLYMGSFNRKDENKKASKKLYNQIKNKLKSPHIIVDLRNNGGGASKISDPFLKLLKKSKAKIYIITNSFTISNGEQFTLKLKDKTNAIHLGQTTYGAVAYGSNYGNLYTTPSEYFSFYPTDMDFHKAYYQYEGFGITPDIKLTFERDWIEQTLDLINKDHDKS